MDRPLAYRMRPASLREVLGQKRLLGPGGFLTNCVRNKALVSMILYGPSGTGKTTIAQCLAHDLALPSEVMNAVTTSKADMLKGFEKASSSFPTLVVIDEIHRLPKDKQDLLLPFLEDGDFYLCGTTTANPFVSLNPALRSRVHILETEPLSDEDIVEGLRRAEKDERGLAGSRRFSPDALKLIATLSAGDLRFAYNLMEILSLSYGKDRTIGAEEVKAVRSVPNFLSDEDEDEHYDTVSGLQKSIRGSQVDAALFYLAKLLQGGDLEGLIRRLLVTAYEDVGLGNPQAVDRCFNACQVAREVGLPEAAIPLGFSVVDLSLSPKSKSSCLAIESALEAIERHPEHVPAYLRLHPVGLSKEASYPYDRPDLWPRIQYMPEGMESVRFYFPWSNGKYEEAIAQLKERLEKGRRSRDISALKREGG